jgi:hypothetical protein
MWKGCLAVTTVLALLGQALPVAAQSKEEARPRDLQRLQDDLANLDEALQHLDPNDPTADSFRQRADDVRDQVIYLKVTMQRHQKDGGEGTGVTYEEVADVRTAITDLREDVERSFAGADRRELNLEPGTEFLVRLEEPLSSRTARPEDRFDATVFQPVRAGRLTAVPAGSRVRGIVRNVEPARHASKGGRLDLAFDALYLGNLQLDLRASVESILQDPNRVANKAGIGAVLGAVLGGIVGGRSGAAVGSILGGTGAVVATKGDEVDLPAGTVIRVRLDAALAVPAD